MKTHPARHSSGFTLIELITVIAIISVLMALLFPHLAAARENARRQEAATNLKTAMNACLQYKSDYGKYPPIDAALAGDPRTNSYYSYGDITNGKCKADNNKLFDVLRAIPRNENVDHKLNFRQVKYMEGKKATDPKNPRDGFMDGSEFESARAGQFMDPWGAQYCLILEADGDEIIDVSEFYTDLNNKEDFIRGTAAGFAMGKDNKPGGKGYEGKLKKDKSNEPSDDIVTWQ